MKQKQTRLYKLTKHRKGDIYALRNAESVSGDIVESAACRFWHPQISEDITPESSKLSVNGAREAIQEDHRKRTAVTKELFSLFNDSTLVTDPICNNTKYRIFAVIDRP